MATVNIRRDISDPFYRYKMERIQSKIEGKGNGIKTVIVNLSSVAHSLAREPGHIIKYFGFELGAQTNTNPSDDRWIINGAHEASKLQDHLDGFINKFVLCKKCKNPETDMSFPEGRIILKCKACGERSDVDLRQKLSSFILKQAPKKGKKDKSNKKAERKARKEREQHEHEEGSNDGSPHDSNSDNAEENGDVEVEANSDDELTRRINSEAKNIEIEENKEVEWTVDTSEAAVKARADQLADDLKRTVIANGGDEDDEEGGNNVYDQLGSWIIKEAEGKGGVAKVKDVDIYVKAKEFGIEKKYKTLTVLAQTIFDEGIVKQIDSRAGMLKKMITSERHEKALLGGTERFVGIDKPALIPQVSAIMMKYYENDLVTEEVFTGWGSKASKKYVDMSTSRKVRKSADQFMKWLETAESEEEDSD
ncbi:putative eukaryotic translation initiation factor 5 [Pseudovirgaria hyperparasitica]|uniref:Putative eukaryotic translation initiation factor 5 n=1 Tax=Pseudovirgaria hyperparasitica TaxID=470096 RepID=A0A6A6WND6_9PEZI|nr:putative eukaryotic translation initiation factor 5 [Pseudovirgaria hyperparasitica]KAF2763559.1 putative eukaryotic translation initiation factor 5 [Pseudovirgaria hyperparasitica]